MVPITRVQTGVRIEQHLLKVLKGLAEYLDVSLGELIEGVALHALEGRSPFEARTLDVVADLRRVYGLTLSAADSHQLAETPDRLP